jgi:hypothetical protein
MPEPEYSALELRLMLRETLRDLGALETMRIMYQDGLPQVPPSGPHCRLSNGKRIIR